jgi:hypothetical protein
MNYTLNTWTLTISEVLKENSHLPLIKEGLRVHNTTNTHKYLPLQTSSLKYNTTKGIYLGTNQYRTNFQSCLWKILAHKCQYLLKTHIKWMSFSPSISVTCCIFSNVIRKWNVAISSCSYVNASIPLEYG